MKGKYDSIMKLPHHTSVTRKRMSAEERAAQFAPYAALTGYGDCIIESARLTSERVELDESEIERLDLALRDACLRSDVRVVITYFLADGLKSGGAYIRAVGKIKDIDEYEGVIRMTDGLKIPIYDVINVEESDDYES